MGWNKFNWLKNKLSPQGTHDVCLSTGQIKYSSEQAQSLENREGKYSNRLINVMTEVNSEMVTDQIIDYE